MKAAAIRSTETSTRQDVYSRVTAKIIADLEQGVRTWMKPWSGANTEGRVTLPLRHNSVPYRGINILLLWGEALACGYTSNRWMTYRQAIELGAHVRKGEHGSFVVYADHFTKKAENESGEEIERQIPFMKGYTVFNAEQIEGLAAEYYDRPAPVAEKMQLIESAENFFAATGATFRHGGNMAYYAPGPDVIQLPHPEAFKDAESYAAITHLPGRRLRRRFDPHSQGPGSCRTGPARCRHRCRRRRARRYRRHRRVRCHLCRAAPD